jgi:hypothetical protein
MKGRQMIAKRVISKKAVDIREQHKQQEAERERLLDERFAHIESEISLLLNCACRCVDETFGIPGTHNSRPQLVGSVLLAMIEKIKLDVWEETTKEEIHQITSSLEGIADAIADGEKRG